jgi:hypothetical protein
MKLIFAFFLLSSWASAELVFTLTQELPAVTAGDQPAFVWTVTSPNFSNFADFTIPNEAANADAIVDGYSTWSTPVLQVYGGEGLVEAQGSYVIDAAVYITPLANI